MSLQELHPEKMQNNLGHAIIVLKERGRVGAENRIMARTGCTFNEAVYAIGLALRLLPELRSVIDQLYDDWATAQEIANHVSGSMPCTCLNFQGDHEEDCYWGGGRP